MSRVKRLRAEIEAIKTADMARVNRLRDRAWDNEVIAEGRLRSLNVALAEIERLENVLAKVDAAVTDAERRGATTIGRNRLAELVKR